MLNWESLLRMMGMGNEGLPLKLHSLVVEGDLSVGDGKGYMRHLSLELDHVPVFRMEKDSFNTFIPFA